LWDRLHFLRDLLRTLRELERRGLIYGDGNLGNVFRRNWTGRAVFIDIDSVSIVKPVAWPDGTKAPRNHGKGVESLLPPEVKGDDGSPNSSYTLAHVCAMYAWHVLSNNTHPCELLNKDGRPVDGMKPYLEQLECGRFGPSFDPQYRTPVEAGVPFASLPERLQGHFERSFSIGGLRDPMNRPLARQWVEAVDAWYSSLLTRRAAVASLCTLGIAGVAGELYRRLAGSAAPATKSTRQQAQETPAPPPPAKEERPRPTLWKLKTLEDRP
jgi:DNA-binding helix-hairpin-helix protein with protein kinase domain